MRAPAAIWQQLLDRDPPGVEDRKGKRRHEGRQALSILRNYHTALYEGKRGAILSQEQASALYERIREGVSLATCRLRVSFINRGLRGGIRELGWQATLLPRIVTLKRELPPFTETSFIALKQVRELEAAFRRDLEQTVRGSSDSARFYGQLLLSAILYGGLLHESWLDAWLEGIPTGIRGNGHCIWIEMHRSHEVTVPSGAGRQQETRQLDLHRRWFADPLTEALIYRALKLLKRADGGGEATTAALHAGRTCKSWGYLRSYLRDLGFGKTDLCKSQKMLLKYAGIRAALELPPALASYASGNLASVSLPSATWTRLLTGKRVPVDRKGPELELSRGLLAPSRVPMGQRHALRTMEQQEGILRELRNALYRKKDEPKGKRFLHTRPHEALTGVVEVETSRSDQMFPILYHLLGWMKYLLAPNRVMRSRALKPSTVERYLSSIGSILLAEAGDRDLGELTSEELADLYEEATFAKRSATERGRSLEAMARFHMFLVETAGLPLVTLSCGAGKIPIEATVNANIITPTMYRMVQEVLGAGQPGLSRCRQVSVLLTILAFRCGLRDAEGRFLLMSDIQGNSKPELIIRTNQHFTPKSKDSCRRIPLHLLLDPQKELPFLIEWRRKRLVEEDARPTDLLFDAGNNTPYSNNEVIDPVKEALRQVSGDQNLVFHNLRHSCATWLLVQLLLPLREGVVDGFPFLADPEFAHKQISQLRHAFLGEDTASRQGLYLLALLLGHGSPEITMERYLHMCDWLLWAECNNPGKAVPLTEKAVLAITQLCRSNVWNSHRKAGTELWSIHPYLRPMRRKWAQVLVEPLAASVSDIDTTPLPDVRSHEAYSEEQQGIRDWRIVQRVLVTCQIYPHRIREQADSWDIGYGEISSWLARAASIGNMATKAGYRRHLGEYVRNVPILGVGEVSEQSVPFPRPPRDGRDIALVDRIFSRLAAVAADSRASLLAGVEFFLHHYLVFRGGVRVWQRCQALRYIEFLSLIGVTREYVRLMLYASQGAGEEERERLLSWWADSLGIGREYCGIAGNGDVGRCGAGSIVIKVVAYDSPRVLQTSFKKWSERNKVIYLVPKASPGFRYAMYQVAILLDDCRIECGATKAADLSRWDAFRSYLRETYISWKYGRKLGCKGIQDAIARCKRIERCLELDLDKALDGQSSGIKRVLGLIEAHADAFAFEGDLRKGIANTRNAAQRYHDYLVWKRGDVE